MGRDILRSRRALSLMGRQDTRKLVVGAGVFRIASGRSTPPFGRYEPKSETHRCAHSAHNGVDRISDGALRVAHHRLARRMAQAIPGACGQHDDLYLCVPHHIIQGGKCH